MTINKLAPSEATTSGVSSPDAASPDASSPDTPDPAHSHKLRGNLGVASIVFMVAAAASPLGVIGGPVPIAISIGNGTGFPATYIIAGVVLLLFAVGFTAMTPFVTSAGAFYSYVEKGLGRSAGLGTGFLALLSYLALEAGVYGLIGPGINSLLVSYGVPNIPWWVYAAVAFAVVTFLGYRNIELSGKVLAVGLLAEVVIVLVLDAVIVVRGGPDGPSAGIVEPHAILSGAPGVGILFAILSFPGFEATAIFRDEARQPNRTIPKATYLSLGLIGAFYALSSWALITAVGDNKAVKVATADPSNMLSNVTQQYLGSVGEHIIQVLFVTSLFACILSFHNVVSRYIFALSGRGALHGKLGVPHGRFGSPHRASVATAVVVGVLLLAGIVTGIDPGNQYYVWLAGFASIGIVLLYAITSGAVVTFFVRRRRGAGLDAGAGAHLAGSSGAGIGTGTGAGLGAEAGLAGHSGTSPGAGRSTSHEPVGKVNLWKGIIAPALALLSLIGFLILIGMNLSTVVGSSILLQICVIALLVIAFALGPIVVRLRKAKIRGWGAHNSGDFLRQARNSVREVPVSATIS